VFPLALVSRTQGNLDGRHLDQSGTGLAGTCESGPHRDSRQNDLWRFSVWSVADTLRIVPTARAFTVSFLAGGWLG
jgi:hypothetical protein